MNKNIYKMYMKFFKKPTIVRTIVISFIVAWVVVIFHALFLAKDSEYDFPGEQQLRELLTSAFKKDKKMEKKKQEIKEKPTLAKQAEAYIELDYGF
tara:strand:- start:9640 stop:9927 length:288 start_codon:yes stop_codon:yes gene_type:complete